MNIVTEIDFNILNSIVKGFKCEFLDYLMPFITVFGDHGIFPISVAVLLLIIPKTRNIGLSMAFAFIYGGFFGNIVLKNAVGRLRPYDAYYVESLFNEGDLLIGGLSDFSFPSGHTLIMFELAVVLLICLKGRKKLIAYFSLLFAFLVAFSRLYLYVHFPSDVLVGAILGTIFGIMGTKTAELLIRKLHKRNG